MDMRAPFARPATLRVAFHGAVARDSAGRTWIETRPSRLKAELQTPQGRARSFNRFAERSDLIFLMRRRHGNAQSRGSFGNRRITNRRYEKSFILERRRQIQRRSLVTDDPRKNRASGSVFFVQSTRRHYFLHQPDFLPKQESALLAFGR